MRSWEEMAAFRHVLVTDCFVLSWAQRDGGIVFEILASLWPGHPLYAPPPPADWTCYREATLRFPNAARVDGLRSMAETPCSTDPDGSVDYGSIDSLWQADDGSYRLDGDFGDVTIESEAPTLEVQ